MQRWLLALGGVLILLVGGWWFSSDDAQPPAERRIDDSVPLQRHILQEPRSVTTWAPPTLHYDTYDSRYGRLPESLVGTPIPFFLTVDAQQQLVPTEALRRLFEYFFTTVGEEPLATIVARIKELLTTHLPEPAASQALEALDQYLALKEAELALEEQLARDFAAADRQLDIHERARLLRDLRATHLPRDLYQAFYGEEDQRDDYALQRLEIMRDTRLSEAEKALALQGLEGDLPASLQEHVREQRHEREVSQRIEAARERGASQAEIFQIRADVYGFEAAQRFAEADQRKASWEARILDYRRERAGILASSAFTDSDKQQYIESLRAQHFDPQEQRRLPAIDRIWDEREGVIQP